MHILTNDFSTHLLSIIGCIGYENDEFREISIRIHREQVEKKNSKIADLNKKMVKMAPGLMHFAFLNIIFV